ncbi:MAG: ELWxxDGT repeat protein, partial [Bacteroidota bacterium]
GNPNFKFAWSGELYFAANDGTNGVELWKSDGTAAGTSMVKDIRPDGNSSPSQFFAYDGELYFRANDGTTGVELWKTDGTEAGTVRVSDIQAGDGSSRPSDFFVVAGNLFFVADDGEGKELWISAGDSVSTRKIVDFNPEGDGNPREFTQTIDGDYWFVADTSDMDASAVLYRISLGDQGLALGRFPFLLEALDGNDPEDLTFTGTSIYFSYEGVNSGRELAFLNLVNGTLFLPPEISDGAASSEIDEITLAGNFVFFEAQDTSGLELYSSLASTARISYVLPDGTILGLGDTIDFGAVTPGFTATDFLFIANTGTDTSLVTNANFAAVNEPFDVDDSNFNGFLPPTLTNWPALPVSYSPTTTGEFMDTVIITSASQVNDFFFFFLRGTTVVPDMSVAANGAALATAETVDFGDVPTGLDSTTTVTISNNGEGLLVLRSASLTSG